MANSWRNNISSNYTLFMLNLSLLFLCTLIYLINDIIPMQVGFRSNYLNDLLAMPLLLSYSNCLCILNKKYLKILHIIILFFVCSILWEFITPMILAKSVKDYLDILQYAIGTIIYISINQRA